MTSVATATALDLTGMTFGRLTAVEPTEERRSRSVVWRCQCACGREALVSAHCLVHDFTKSCGCLGTGKSGRSSKGEDLVTFR